MSTSTPNHERRLCRRRSAKPKVRICCKKGVMDLGPNLAQTLLDFSEAGVRLIAKSGLIAGDEVSIVLETVANGKPVKRVGQVEWTVPTESGAFCIGVEFQQRLGYVDMQDLM